MTPEELAQLQEMVTKAAELVEGKLAASLNTAIEGINSKIETNEATTANLQATAKTAFETLPNIIQEKVENQLEGSLKVISEEIGKQFEGKMKALATGGKDGEGAPGGLNLPYLLEKSDKIVEVINAFRSPTTEQAMMGQMAFVMKWHGLLSKLEKGGGTGDEVTKAIADTFTNQTQEK